LDFRVTKSVGGNITVFLVQGCLTRATGLARMGAVLAPVGKSSGGFARRGC